MNALPKILTLSLTVLAGAQAVSAKSGYLTQFAAAYPGASDTLKNSCAVCHTTPPTKNSYGRAYADSGRNYASIEALDSDGDGFSNLIEINAGSFPGNALSKPGLPAPDPIAPTVTGFATKTTKGSLTVAIKKLAAKDNTGVTGYRVSESATQPAADAAGWSATPPTNYVFATIGKKALYAYAKDNAGNVSLGKKKTLNLK